MKISPELISDEMRENGVDENTEFSSREDMVARLGEDAVVAIEIGATAHVANVEGMVEKAEDEPAPEPVVEDKDPAANPSDTLNPGEPVATSTDEVPA